MTRGYTDRMRAVPLLVLALAFLTAPALAHVRLDRAEPKVGSTVNAAPAEVKIWFSDDVGLTGTTVEVTDASGARVDKDDVHLDAKDKSIAIVSLSDKLPPGKYKVIWNALCEDGHKTKGTFRFEVAPNHTP
jgi:methionine-rich copper-binding protein CopC